jgi:threonine dehydrogenase-like Zn-dependent dehydrogenase
MTDTGRVANFAGARQPFGIEEYPIPEPQGEQALVRIERASICGSDLHFWRGEDPAVEHIATTQGLALGHETVGRVARLGEAGATDATGRVLAIGDPVIFPYFTPCFTCRACRADRPHMCPEAQRSAVLRHSDEPPHFVGGFGDYLVVPKASFLVVLPDGLGVDDVVGANCAAAQALFALERVGLVAGERVVVQGAGGLGLFAIAGARARGAESIVAIDAVGERLDAARAFGATGVVDVREIPDARDRVTAVRDHLGGGADVVVEVAGVRGVIAEGLRMLDRGGRYAEVGSITPDGDRIDLPAVQLVQRNIAIFGIGLYHPRILLEVVELLAALKGEPALAELIGGRRYPLERIDQAFADLDAHPGLARPTLDMTI